MPVLPTVPMPAICERGGQPVFYYDLGDPLCYLVAEQVMRVLPVVPEWEPVQASQLRAATPRADPRAIEQRAQALGLQPLCWPDAWPMNTREAMLAATYAKQIGRAVAFSLAAFRQAFAAGRDLEDRDTILIAGAACEMHPAALLKAIGTRSVASALDQATIRAGRAGVQALPAIQASGQVFSGEEAIALAGRAVS